MDIDREIEAIRELSIEGLEELEIRQKAKKLYAKFKDSDELHEYHYFVYNFFCFAFGLIKKNFAFDRREEIYRAGWAAAPVFLDYLVNESYPLKNKEIIIDEYFSDIFVVHESLGGFTPTEIVHINVVGEMPLPVFHEIRSNLFDVVRDFPELSEKIQKLLNLEYTDLLQ